MCSFFTARRDFTEDNIEVGTLMMKKKKTEDPKKVPFVRTKDLVKHVEELLKRHLKKKNTWDHDEFSGFIWIKIGVSFAC